MSAIGNIDIEHMKEDQEFQKKATEKQGEWAAQGRQYVPGDVGFPPGQIYGPINSKLVLQKASGIGLNDVKSAEGTKYDGGKPRMDLLDAPFLEGVASVLTFGANKYAAHNWRGGIHYSRLIASLYRHLGAINRGEDTDPESGLPHIYHLGCNAMFLASMMNVKPELDDRYKA